MKTLLINYIHKPQCIDKALPILLGINRLGFDIEVLTILDLEEHFPNAISADIEFFLEEQSHRIYKYKPLPKRKTKKRFLGINVESSISKLRAWVRMLGLLRKEKIYSREKIVMLSANTAHTTYLGLLLLKKIKKINIGYFKSLNDQGVGITAATSRKSLKWTRYYDYILLPSDSFKERLSLRTSSETLVPVGHLPFFGGWKEYVSQNAGRFILLPSPRSTVMTVFARGPVAHKNASEQIITSDIERKLLIDLIETYRRLAPKGVVLIKPHPYQNLDVIKEICRRYSDVRTSNLSPATLAAVSDLCVSTFSSSAVDILGFGKPSIEYFNGTEAFHRLHPNDTVFARYGVVVCRTKAELQEALVGALDVRISASPLEFRDLAFRERDFEHVFRMVCVETPSSMK